MNEGYWDEHRVWVDRGSSWSNRTRCPSLGCANMVPYDPDKLTLPCSNCQDPEARQEFNNVMNFLGGGYWDSGGNWIISDPPPLTMDISPPKEPDCVCERLSVGHEKDCAWKQWKDSQ